MRNLREIVDRAAARLGSSPTARRDAELLVMRAAGRDRAWLMTHPEAELTASQTADLESWIARRARHEPLQYILGEAEFYGLTFRVTPDVLIPRPETEHLVEAVLERVGQETAVRICDVGTGSGCIAVALAHGLRRAQVTALDLSRAALAVAKGNAERAGVDGRVRFVESDLLRAVRGERFDVVVSNPPYVRDDEVLEAQVREHEPHAALFAGATGLEVYERLIPEAHEALVPGGWLLMEIGHGQRDALARLLRSWDGVCFVPDLQGIPRVALAQRRA
ncbi:MAG TPA: peptide chain release factor N(5)-glutamine methyltransferase [Acidobacteriaceae bacterium]|nr:peptide chain release factor N(5)-glutamine methyltransferase [Acidobacteriaceae bacterium]